jgi:hypothetical protein
MKRRNRILLIFAFTMLFFLSGCVSLVQEITVADDGSGTLLFAIGVDSASYPQFVERIPEGYQLENFLATLIQDESTTNVQQDQYESDGKVWESIQLEVSNFSQLFAEDRRIGPLIISLDQDEDEYFFYQTMDMEGANIQIPGINLVNFAGAAYIVRLSAPQITNTNGVQPSVDVSEWEIPLEDFLRGDEAIYLQAAYKLEPYDGVFIPWEVFFPYVVIGFLSLGILSIFTVIIVNSRKKNEDIPKIKF